MGAVIRFLNPFNDEFDAFSIQVNLTAGIIIELLSDFTLSGKLDKISMKVTDLKTYFQTNVK